MSDLKWDPKRHDERLPPKDVVTQIVCSADDCKGTIFVQMVRLFDVTKGQIRELGHRTAAYKCAACGTDYPLGGRG